MPIRTDHDNEFESESALPIDRASVQDHAEQYVATLITPAGLLPINTLQDFEAVLQARDRALKLNEPAMLFGISKLSLASRTDRDLWLSGTGIAAPDGLSLFDLKSIELAPG